MYPSKIFCPFLSDSMIQKCCNAALLAPLFRLTPLRPTQYDVFSFRTRVERRPHGKTAYSAHKRPERRRGHRGTVIAGTARKTSPTCTYDPKGIIDSGRHGHVIFHEYTWIFAYSSSSFLFVVRSMFLLATQCRIFSTSASRLTWNRLKEKNICSHKVVRNNGDDQPSWLSYGRYSDKIRGRSIREKTYRAVYCCGYFIFFLYIASFLSPATQTQSVRYTIWRIFRNPISVFSRRPLRDGPVWIANTNVWLRNRVWGVLERCRSRVVSARSEFSGPRSADLEKCDFVRRRPLKFLRPEPAFPATKNSIFITSKQLRNTAPP